MQANLRNTDSLSKQLFELESAISYFVIDFELVFDLDWDYAKDALADGPFISDKGTFINPDETTPLYDWANREKLLDSYRRLIDLLDKHNIPHSQEME